MSEKRVQFSQDVPIETKDGLDPSKLSQFESLESVAKTIEQGRHISPPTTPTRQKINIVFVVDLELKTVTLRHRQAVLECIRVVCQEMEANLVLVNYNELNSNKSSALDSFYDADASIIDISIEGQRNTLFYHLGVRESFSMKQNILVVANLTDKLPGSQQIATDYDTCPLTHDSASQIKSLLPNYPLFVYSIQQPDPSNDSHNDCFVDQKFIDLTYSPGSDEQIDPCIPDFDDLSEDGVTDPMMKNERPTFVITETGTVRNTDEEQNDGISAEDAPLNLKGQLKEALKNVKWQAKAHMKDKFLADLKKARETYQGEELYKFLQSFRHRLDDPNMLSIDVVYQMLVSFQEVQDYDSMVKLVDDLSKFPNLIKITSSPQILFHYAFALNRRRNSGDRDRALKLITSALERKEHQIPDTICLCGRIFKDLFIESSYEDRDSLKNAIDWYRKGFKISPNEYAAINLATLLYIAGHEFKTSSELKHVGLVLNNLIGKKGPVHKLNNYWDVATYFEFCLLANQFAKAIEAASCMFSLNPSKWHLKSTIGNIRLIYRFKPKTFGDQSKYSSSSYSDSTSYQQLEVIQSPEEQIVEFWMDFFIDAVVDSCDNQIRFAALVLEQNNEYMPTYITMNLDAEEKSITISQMCIDHLRDLNGCRKPHLWHIKATGVRGISLYKRDERCVFLYVHDNSDDFQIFFPSESIRARFKSLVLSITGNRSIDISANLQDSDRKINFVYERDKNENRITLGRGSRGVVYAARDVDTQTQIAIKEVPVKNIGEVQPLHEEIRLHSMLRHRNIVQYLGTSHEGDYFRIIMERVPGGSLSQLLQREWGPLNENVIAYYSRQILDGLQYLHRQKIVHRDIKGDNVLVNPYTGILKISDFGTCKRLAAINPNTETFAGTVAFMAPELLDRGQRGYSMPADIWSFGCTVVEMASGKPPFIDIGASGPEVMFLIGFYKKHPEIPSELSDKCKQFILRCFEPNTDYRATCDDLLLDPFLDEARPLSSMASAMSPRKSSITSQTTSHQFSTHSASVTPPTPPTSRMVSNSTGPMLMPLKETPSTSGGAPGCRYELDGKFHTVGLRECDPGSGRKPAIGKLNLQTSITSCLNTASETIYEEQKSAPKAGQVQRLTLESNEADANVLELCEEAFDDEDYNDGLDNLDDLSDGDETFQLAKCHMSDSNDDADAGRLTVTTTSGEMHKTDPVSTSSDRNNCDKPPTCGQRKATHPSASASSGGDRRKLIESNRRLAAENRQLWRKLRQVQEELNELLQVELDEKQAQVAALRGCPAPKSTDRWSPGEMFNYSSRSGESKFP